MKSNGIFSLGLVMLILAGVFAMIRPESYLALVWAIWGGSLIITSNER